MLKDEAFEKHDNPASFTGQAAEELVLAVRSFISLEAIKTQRAHSLFTLVDIGADHRQEEGNDP